MYIQYILQLPGSLLSCVQTLLFRQRWFYHLSSYLQEHVLRESHSAKTDLYPWRCTPVACKTNSYFRPWALSKTKEYIVWRLILLCIHSVMIIYLALLAESARQPPYTLSTPSARVTSPSPPYPRQNEWNIATCTLPHRPSSFLSGLTTQWCRTTESTQSGNGRFLVYIPSWWKN